jgi:CRISPR-associated endonuclease/helicase Cas3
VDSSLPKFQADFAALQGNDPFPWQERLFLDFCHGDFPSALDLPTGLGKTSVMAIWYLALAAGARLPRRLVYVVDRRVVVDQATTVAEAIKEKSVDRALPISTLRGKFVDNRQWLADPTSPAIIVGTVDMVGSRLLFSGYGVTGKMRPYHAGLLGADTLVVLDEAHLVPPFEALLEAIARDPESELGPRAEHDRKIIPPFRLISLSATGRDHARGVFRLADDDYKHEIIKQRLHAKKRLTLYQVGDSRSLVNELAGRAWTLGTQERPARVLVYCNSRDDALKVKDQIDKRGREEKIDVASELLVGARRVRERERLVRWLENQGFVGEPRGGPPMPSFLIATSAGEVGIDLDADHMVCDLVEWERMVQRLGRVNRRGGKDARVEVIAAPPKESKADAEDWGTRLARLRRPIDRLDGGASPAAIVALKNDTSLKNVLQEAQTPAPLRPALTRSLVDAWSMTSLDEHAGRPEVGPWLRGWVKDEPQTTIVWRRYLPVRTDGGNATRKEIDEFFEAAPPQTSETLEVQTWAVVEWLIARAGRALKSSHGASVRDGSNLDHAVVLVLDRKDELVLDPKNASRSGTRALRELAGLGDKDKKRDKDVFAAMLIERTLVVSSLLGGLNLDGMLDDKFDGAASAMDAAGAWEPARPFRVREMGEPVANRDRDWKEIHRFVADRAEDGEPRRWLIVEQARGEARSEEGRAIARLPQRLIDHRSRVEQILSGWAGELKLPDTYIAALMLVGRLHDEGKRAPRWQRAFSAPRDDTYAKTQGPVSQELLDGYRHEFGSLPYLERDADFKALPSDLQDLALHLVAAHHGGARPLIATRSCEDAPPSVLEARAREVALRFAILQKRWGPWGLAWWEALLRAADQRASGENEARADPGAAAPNPGKEA